MTRLLVSSTTVGLRSVAPPFSPFRSTALSTLSPSLKPISSVPIFSRSKSTSSEGRPVRRQQALASQGE